MVAVTRVQASALRGGVSAPPSRRRPRGRTPPCRPQPAPSVGRARQDVQHSTKEGIERQLAVRVPRRAPSPAPDEAGHATERGGNEAEQTSARRCVGTRTGPRGQMPHTANISCCVLLKV